MLLRGGLPGRVPSGGPTPVHWPLALGAPSLGWKTISGSPGGIWTPVGGSAETLGKVIPGPGRQQGLERRGVGVPLRAGRRPRPAPQAPPPRVPPAPSPGRPAAGPPSPLPPQVPSLSPDPLSQATHFSQDFHLPPGLWACQSPGLCFQRHTGDHHPLQDRTVASATCQSQGTEAPAPTTVLPRPVGQLPLGPQASLPAHRRGPGRSRSPRRPEGTVRARSLSAWGQEAPFPRRAPCLAPSPSSPGAPQRDDGVGLGCSARRRRVSGPLPLPLASATAPNPPRPSRRSARRPGRGSRGRGRQGEKLCRSQDVSPGQGPPPRHTHRV